MLPPSHSRLICTHILNGNKHFYLASITRSAFWRISVWPPLARPNLLR